MERNSFLKDLLARFIRDLDYHPEERISDDNVCYQSLQFEFSAYNTGPWFDALCRESATIAEVSRNDI